MKKFALKLLITGIMIVFVITTGKGFLSLKSKEMGGDFDLAVKYLMNKDYLKAVKAFTGDTKLLEEDNELKDVTDIINQDKGILEGFTDIINEIDSISDVLSN